MAKKAKDKEKDKKKVVSQASETLKIISTQLKARKAAQEAVDAAVIRARAEGCSWVAIAKALGISPQGARQKYLARVPAAPSK